MRKNVEIFYGAILKQKLWLVGDFFTPIFSIQRSSEYCMTVESERFLTVITSNCEISLSYYITVKSLVKNIKV